MSTAGGIAGQFPAGEDHLVRRLAQAKADAREDAAAQIAAIAGTVRYLSSLITRDATMGSVNSGSLTGDATFRAVGTEQMRIENMAVPTGRLRVTVSCAEASVSPTTGAVIGSLAWGIEGSDTLPLNVGGVRAVRLYSNQARIGASLSSTWVASVDPDSPVTVIAQPGAWATIDGASVNFGQMTLTAEVVGDR